MPRYKKLQELIVQKLNELDSKDKTRHDYKDLADIINVPHSSFYRWASGNGYPQDKETQDKMAELLGPDFWIAIGEVPSDIDKNFLRLVIASKHDPNIERLLNDALDTARKQQENNLATQLQLTV